MIWIDNATYHKRFWRATSLHLETEYEQECLSQALILMQGGSTKSGLPENLQAFKLAQVKKYKESTGFQADQGNKAGPWFEKGRET